MVFAFVFFVTLSVGCLLVGLLSLVLTPLGSAVFVKGRMYTASPKLTLFTLLFGCVAIFGTMYTGSYVADR